MRNIEIKAKIDHPNNVIARLKDMDISGPTIIKQHDTFFKVPDGRLKLREFHDGTGELIFYKRFDTLGPKLCNYHKVALSPGEVKGLIKILTASNGLIGIVKKTRNLYMIGQTRVHVDDVEGLGYFMELEVALQDSETAAEGEKIAQDLMTKLGIDSRKLIGPAYIDLLTESGASSATSSCTS